MGRIKRISLTVAAVFLAVTLAVPSASFVGLGENFINENEARAATAFFDVNGHWAQYYILQGAYYGIIKGDGSNKFQPDKPVTRAEFATMVNKAFGSVLGYDVTFSDVSKKEWYYDTVCKSVNSGITSGYEDGTYRPNRKITRQEAAVMVARLLAPEGASKSVFSYNDGRQVDDWANEAFSRVLSENLMGAYDDGNLHPKSNLTRAQAVAILVKLKERKKDVVDDFKITKGAITYQDKIYGNSVEISEKIGNEEVIFKNCVFLGPVKIRGGGEKSIHFKNCRAKYVEVDKPGGTVRVVSEDRSIIGQIDTYGSSIIETDDNPRYIAGTGFGQVRVKANAAATLDGIFGDVRIDGENAAVKLEDANVSYLGVPKNASKAGITLSHSSYIAVASVYSQTDFHGTGNIGKLYAGVKEITYETAPNTVTLGEDVRVSPIKVPTTLALTCTPGDKETGVAFDTKVVLTFNQPIYRNGRTITLDYVKSKVKFTSKKSSGTEVPYTITSNSDKSVFTLTPTEDLTKKTKYYITIDKDVFSGEDKKLLNKKFSTMFTTGDGTLDGVTFKPEKDSGGAKTNVKPSIKFKEAIIGYDGEELEAGKNSIYTQLVFYKYDPDRKDGKGKSVSFEAELSKKKNAITVTPKTALEDNTQYVIGIKNNSFRYQKSNNPISEQKIIFTVGHVVPTVTFDPKSERRIGTSESFDLKFSQPLLTKDLKKLTSTYVQTALSLTAGGQPVEFKVDSIDTDESKTTISISNKTAFSEGSKVILKVLPGMLSNKNKKTVEEAVAEYEVPLNTPGISGLSATGVGGSVTASFTSNRAGIGYVVVTDGNNTLTAAEVRSRGTSGTIAKGSNYITVNSTTIKAGKTYTVYAVGVSGSYVSEAISTRVTTKYDVAHANEVRLVGFVDTTGSGITLSAGAISDTMEIVVDTSVYRVDASGNVRLEIDTDSGTTVLFYDTATGDYETEGINGRISYLDNFSPSDFVAGNTVTVKFKAVCTVMEDKIYTVTIKSI